VRQSEIVEDAFSARFSARQRTYVYAILNRRAPSALLARYAWHVAQPLDLTPMRAASACFVGQHDFRSFAAAASEERTVREIYRLRIEPHGELIRLEISANGFLHHMVRTIVGTLAECGEGRRNASAVAAVLAGGDRAAAGLTAPAAGLYLAGVRYGDGYDSFAEPPIFGTA
jgi:tRNA pseudouridine38-40 synthase